MTVEIRIVLEPETGKLSVSGPVHEKILCLGMLDMARQQLHDHWKRTATTEEQKRIVLAKGPLPTM